VQNLPTDTVAAATKWGDIGDWDVSDVTDFSLAFSEDRTQAGGENSNTNLKSAHFDGTGLAKWDTSSVTTLQKTFFQHYTEDNMNPDLSGWDVAKVTSMRLTFAYASKFEGTGLSKWNIAKVTDILNAFISTGSLTSCNKRKIVNAWKSNSAFVATSYDTDWAGEPWCIGARLSDVQFKEASWDWVQNLPTDTVAAATKWGDIGDWDVSDVTDFSYAFSKHRDATGGALKPNLNPKAVSFVSTDLSTWKTNAVTTLEGAFGGALSMNQGISNFDVSKVVSLKSTFEQATSFNAILNWDVSKVATLEQTFKNADSLLSGGLSKWDTGAVTTLKKAFEYAGLIDVDFGTWITSNVENM
jgi:hypothetical protein